MEVLQNKEKAIEDAALKAGVERRKKELKKFLEELMKAEERRRLRELEESAAQQGLSPEEKDRKKKQIKAIYGGKR